MSVLLYILGVVLFTTGLALSVGLHELGHLIPGKLYDVKITQYFIGFGRTLWSRRRGETEYGVKAIPLGGYVKLVGMLPPDPGTDPTKIRSRATGIPETSLRNRLRRPCFSRVVSAVKSRSSTARAR